MAHTLVPTGNVTFVAEAQIGTVYLYVTIDWGVAIGLTGVPAIVLTDGLGNTHNPERAQPHIATQADWATHVTWRFQGVPAFDTYSVTVPTNMPGIVDAGGDTTMGGSYAAVPAAT